MSKIVVHNPKVLLAHLVEEEQKRNFALEERYRKILNDLPKGKPYIRKSGRDGKAYVYLSRRIPGQKYPESKYVGLPGSEPVKKLQQQLDDRAKLEAQLAVLALERRMIEKALYEYQRTRRSKP